MDMVNEKSLVAFCKDLTKVLEGNIKQQKDLIGSLRKMLEKEEKKCADLEAKLAACREKLAQPPKPKKGKVEPPFNAIKMLKDKGKEELFAALSQQPDDVLDAFLKRLDAHHKYKASKLMRNEKMMAIVSLSKQNLEHGNAFRDLKS